MRDADQPEPVADVWVPPHGWRDPRDNPEIPWIEHPTDDDLADLPVPPADRLAEEQAEVQATPTGKVADELGGEGPPPGVHGLVAPAIAGINLRDYSRNPQARGFGAPCRVNMAAVVLTEARIMVHVALAELAGLIMRAVEARGYRYRKADTGSYNCRPVAGTASYSWHSWAVAIDANWQTNPQRRPVTTDRPRWELDMWNRYGWAWGGDYTGSSIPDAMHTEFMGTAGQAAQATELARRELGQPGLRFPVIGAIRLCFDRVGGVGTLGQPVGPEVPTTGSDPASRWQEFAGGSVWWRPGWNLTAHEVHGEIWRRYNAAGREVRYGFPVTDETRTPDGVGRFNHFEGDRSIYWTPTTGARLVFGAIRAAWAGSGWERGPLGYPVDEEHRDGDLVVQTFQRGKIRHDPTANTTEIVPS